MLSERQRRLAEAPGSAGKSAGCSQALMVELNLLGGYRVYRVHGVYRVSRVYRVYRVYRIYRIYRIFRV